MAGDMRKFHASIKDLKSKIERYMEQYGNSMGTLDKNDFSLILGEKPGFSQNNVAICRLIAWNVLLHRDAPELDKEVVDWANAMRIYTHVVDYPAAAGARFRYHLGQQPAACAAFQPAGRGSHQH